MEGAVYNSSTGEPLKKVQVTLRGMATAGMFGAVTDASGRFSITGVNPGRYMLMAERTGFVRAEYGGRGRRGAAFTLAAGQRLKDVVFRLVPHGVIAGRVLDEDGEPVANASVALLRPGYVAGARRLTPAGGANTNDLGEYRVPGLAAGKYYLSATFRYPPMQGGIAEESYVTTYYPNTLDPGAAAPIELTTAAQLRGMDITLRRARTYRISGRVTVPAGSGRRNVLVFLAPRDTAMHGYGGRSAQMAQDGKFELRNVLPGAYTLAAHSYDEGRRYSASQPLDVGHGDVEGISLTVSPGLEVSGRVRVEGGGQTQFKGARVVLRPVNDANLEANAGGSAAVGEDGSFTINTLTPDAYVVQMFSAPENLYVKSVRAGDGPAAQDTVTIEAGAAALDILLSRAGGQVDGVVMEEQQPAPGVTVVLVPQESREPPFDRSRVSATGREGKFSFKGVPPGDYRLYSWADAEPGAWQDPEFLKRFTGDSVTVRENGRETVQVRLLFAEER